MLKITIPEEEFWDERNQRFITFAPVTLRLEHSLVSIAKWEMKWKKPFLGMEEKTQEQLIDYYKCMTITQNVPDSVYQRFTRENHLQIQEYLKDTQTATWFSEDKNKHGRAGGKIITNERIYAWMAECGIPFDCEKWNINRLLTLIRICNIDNQPSKKMSQKDQLARNWKLNQARKAKRR